MSEVQLILKDIIMLIGFFSPIFVTTFSMVLCIFNIYGELLEYKHCFPPLCNFV